MSPTTSTHLLHHRLPALRDYNLSMMYWTATRRSRASASPTSSGTGTQAAATTTCEVRTTPTSAHVSSSARSLHARCENQANRFSWKKRPRTASVSPTCKALFPEAKWIYLYRDGRDVIVSMDKEWRRRKDIVENRSVAGLVRTAWRMLSRQKYWRNRFLALRHELARNLSLNRGGFSTRPSGRGAPPGGPDSPDGNTSSIRRNRLCSSTHCSGRSASATPCGISKPSTTRTS